MTHTNTCAARIHEAIASADREDAKNGRGSYIDGLRDVEISAENVSANLGAHIEEKLRADDEHETLTDAQRKVYEAAHEEYWNDTKIWAEIVKLDLDRATAAFAD